MDRVPSFTVEYWECEQCYHQNQIESTTPKHLDLGLYVSNLKCGKCQTEYEVERTDLNNPK